ncbi:hypothetical protein IAT38_001531 [Cryptococcus sp. DSM 104549]
MLPKAGPEPTAKLSLPEWLKQLTSQGVDMRVAMGLAAKIYKSHGTIELLSGLTSQKVASLVDDKEARKTISNAVKAIASGTTNSKKRGRDRDLLEPLKTDGAEEEEIPVDMEFHPIMDVGELYPLSITVNRAPVKTAWAYTIAMRLGFDHLESLSIAQAYVHISSLKHALTLGNILNEEEKREAELELGQLPDGDKGAKWKKEKERDRSRGGWKTKGKEAESVGSAQPWVEVMGSKPIIERPDGTCRAIQKSVPVKPSQAFTYISKAFKESTHHVMGALKLIAESYEPQDLNRFGLGMYSEFKPDVVEWGQRGTLELARILEQISGVAPPFTAKEETSPPLPTSAKTSPGPEVVKEGERQTKSEKNMTLEEFEAMLDAEDAAAAVDAAGEDGHDLEQPARKKAKVVPTA